MCRWWILIFLDLPAAVIPRGLRSPVLLGQHFSFLWNISNTISWIFIIYWTVLPFMIPQEWHSCNVVAPFLPHSTNTWVGVLSLSVFAWCRYIFWKWECCFLRARPVVLKQFCPKWTLLISQRNFWKSWTSHCQGLWCTKYGLRLSLWFIEEPRVQLTKQRATRRKWLQETRRTWNTRVD